MLMINTKIKPSTIAGIGLFAAEFIPKGTVVWTYKQKLDNLFTEDEIAAFLNPSKEQFYNYAYYDTTYEQYLLCGDDGRFFNHSSTPNCDDSKKDITIALRDIHPGEELTVDYTTFYGDINDHREIFAV